MYGSLLIFVFYFILGTSLKALANVDCVSLLGLNIDSALSFNAHADKVCKKLASRIAVLRKIRTYLPLPQRIQYYNSIISPVMSYVSVIWSNCDKELLYRVFKLQKRAARVILYAERMAPSVELFNRLKWIPFYEKCKIDKASMMFRRIHGVLPSYLNEHISINNSTHSRTTRYSNFNVLCPRYNRETEGGRTFLVTGTKIWNELPLRIRMADSIRCFKHNMWTNIFRSNNFKVIFVYSFLFSFLLVILYIFIYFISFYTYIVIILYYISFYFYIALY